MIKINNLYRFIFLLILCICLIVPIQGYNTCGPSKGLISGQTLSSNYDAPTGSVSEKPGFIEGNEQSIQTKVNADDFVLIGNSKLESGNYQEAITAYDQAIKSDPTNNMAWNGKMSALLYLDKYEDVISLFADAKKTLPNDFGIWINKGRAEFYLNEFAKSRQSADEALKISPDNIDALVLKADGLAIEAKPGAYEITETVLSLDPDNSDIWFARGHALFSEWARKGHMIEEEREKTIEYFEKDLKFHPDRECSKKLLGLSYQMSGMELNNEGKYEEAIEQYDNSLNINPDDPTTWYEKARSLRKLNRYEEALQACEKSLDLDSDNKDAWYLKGYILYSLNRYEEALDACEKSLDLDSDDEYAWYLKGNILYSLNRYEESLKPINMAISLGHEKAVAFKEKILSKLNEESHSSSNSLNTDLSTQKENNLSSTSSHQITGGLLAGFNLQSAAEKNRYQSVDEYLDAMEAAYNSDDMELMVDLAEEAIELYPANYRFWSIKGAGLNNLERYDEAIEAADKSISLDRSNAHAWFVKGYALEKLGKYDDAEIYYEKSLELDPDDEDYLEGLDRLRGLMDSS